MAERITNATIAAMVPFKVLEINSIAGSATYQNISMGIDHSTPKMEFATR